MIVYRKQAAVPATGKQRAFFRFQRNAGRTDLIGIDIVTGKVWFRVAKFSNLFSEYTATRSSLVRLLRVLQIHYHSGGDDSGKEWRRNFHGKASMFKLDIWVIRNVHQERKFQVSAFMSKGESKMAYFRSITPARIGQLSRMIKEKHDHKFTHAPAQSSR